MKFRQTLVAWLFLLGSSAALAQGPIVPAPPMVAADAYLLMDAMSGEVLIEGDADQRLPPASLTKMMTAYVVESELAAGRLSLDDEVRISEKAWRTGGSKTFVLVDTEVRVEDLMRGIVIQSGNDASIAMAEHLAGTEENFASIMNQYAERMGLTNTNFTNATGLPSENLYSSARDMATLARHVILDHPQYYPWYAEREFTFSDITQPNRNRLLWQNPSVDGLKTGYTEEAGYNLVASAVEGGMRLIAVVMGAATESARIQETQKMLTYGFRYYESRQLHDGESTLHEERIWAGAQDMIDLGIARDLHVTVPKNSGEVRTRIELDGDIQAPVQSGDVLGQLSVELGDEVLAQRDLIALETVEQGGFIKRLVDWVKQFFLGLFS